MQTPTVAIKSLDKSQLADTAKVREFTKRSEALKVFFDNIVVRKGFNLRTDFGDLKSLADSIREEGLKEAITVDILEDGSAVLTDGERRFRAIAMLRAESPELKKQFEYVEALTNDKSATDADRIISMMVHNSGKPFEPLEEAEGFRRLVVDHGLNKTQIAKRVGKSVPYVEQSLLLAGIDEEEKEEIRSGKISATAKKEQIRKEKNPAKRKAQVKEAAAKGKKVRVKDIKSVPIDKEIDKVLALVKKADARNKDGEVQNLLFEIDSELRRIKKEVKK